jgi:DNA adenine methylase
LQQTLFADDMLGRYTRPKGSLLKWIGNKYRMAEQIASYFPSESGTFYDVFLGSGALLATVNPTQGVGSDAFGPLIEIWVTLRDDPETLKGWYRTRWEHAMGGEKVKRYEEIKASYNTSRNAADFLFLSRSCYGGVVRFRKSDGYMSTPCGPHTPISPESFNSRVDEWHPRVQATDFRHADYSDVMSEACEGDVVYCDPPYSHSQAILYGAQEFTLEHLLEVISDCKSRGVFVALSIDGSKRSGNTICDLPIPEDLFEREVFINVGRSMLKRFQSNGKTLESEVVADRLLLTY